MRTGFKSSFKVLVFLLYRDCYVLSKTVKDTLINSGIVIFFKYMLFGLLMPMMGMDRSLITPIFLGMIISIIISVSFSSMVQDAYDLSFGGYITYLQTLPFTINWVIARYVLSYMITILTSTVPVMIFGRILFGGLLDFQGGLFLFFLFYLLSILFFSTFILCICFYFPIDWIKNNTWSRILSPMSLLGCIYYPWIKLNSLSPILGKVALLSPVTYIVEGFRGTIAITGGIEIYICFLAVLCFSVVNITSLLYLVPKRLEAK